MAKKAVSKKGQARKRKAVVETVPVHEQIEKSFERFLADKDYRRGIDTLARRSVHERFEAVKEDYAEFINFYVYRRYMKSVKARKGELSPTSERSLAERGEQALAAYKRILASLGAISKAFTASGIDKALRRHAPKIGQYFDLNPKTPAIVNEFRQMGVPEDAINWVLAEIREKKGNLLRVEGAGGSFAGLVERAESLAPALRKSVQLSKKHGLALFEGAGSDRDDYVAAGIAIGLAIIVGLFTGFCHDWRPAGLPAVRHWTE